jgi:hypothetical protein
MEKKEILEGNKLIAEFMGVDTIVKDGFDVNGKSYLNYESSWKALMPVVEKIEQDTPYNFRIQHLECEVFSIVSDGFISHKNTLTETNGFTKTEAVYDAVIYFIKWHNENNPTKTLDHE